MNMNKKRIILLAVIAGILLISIIVLLMIAQRFQPEASTVVTVSNTNQSTGDTTIVSANTNNTNAVADTVIPVNSGTVDSKTSVYQTARFFTERYGSYSTDNEYENIDSVQAFMTPAMQASATAVRQQVVTNTYYGISTQATNVKFIDFTPSATGATVEVITRRTETTGIDTKQFTQTARLQLKKVNEAWLVDIFKWVEL